MEITSLIQKETQRQRDTLMLIPSENYTYQDVRDAVGSALMHKYSEGYPGKRYYQGNEIIDQIETIAVEEAKSLFGVPHANVQALSGSPANTAVYFGLLEVGDTIMGMDLSSGGHLTHGHPRITFSGKYFKSVQYGIEPDGSINFEKLRSLVLEHKPKILVSGTTAYPGVLDFEKFSSVISGTETLLLADISHIAGLVVAGLHPNPSPYVDVITTTTHKMLRGPRGAIIMVTQKGLEKDPEMAKKIDKAVFPGLQGGPHDNVTAGIAIALKKAGTAEYKEYAGQILKNAKALSGFLKQIGYELVTGGTENHLLLIDLRPNGVTGKEAAVALEACNIVVNANSIPNDTASPMNPSGIRIGTPAITSRGMGINEMKLIADFIDQGIKSVGNASSLKEIGDKVLDLCHKFPVDF